MPITGILGCWARAQSGHAAAAPKALMNSRRFMPVPCRREGIVTAQRRCLIEAETHVALLLAGTVAVDGGAYALMPPGEWRSDPANKSASGTSPSASGQRHARRLRRLRALLHIA